MRGMWEVAVYKEKILVVKMLEIAERYNYQKARIVMDWHIFCFRDATTANLFDIEVADYAMSVLNRELRTEIKFVGGR